MLGKDSECVRRRIYWSQETQRKAKEAMNGSREVDVKLVGAITEDAEGGVRWNELICCGDP